MRIFLALALFGAGLVSVQPDTPTVSALLPLVPSASPAVDGPGEREQRASRSRPVVDTSPVLPKVLLRIRHCESGGDYRARNPVSSASGAFQVITSTWNGYGGYRRAYLAPKAVQDAQALRLFRKQGTRPWVSSKRCWS